MKRIDLVDDFDAVLDAEPFERLNITTAHTRLVATLPLIHDDPFDRLLVAQAMIEGYTLVTVDKKLDAYGIPILRG